MNSYGDGSSARGRAQVGRAQVPGPPGGGPDDEPAGWPADGGYPQGNGGRAAVPTGRAGAAAGGRGTVGRASVSGSPGYQYDDEPAAGRSGGRASVGTASVGSASVGSAAVGASPVGRASVGRVGVPPISPAGPAGPIRPVGTRPPGGPGGPGGPGAVGPDAAKRRKKLRRRNLIIAAFAVFIMLAGGIVVGGTYYYDSVPPPQALDLPEATSIYYADGKTQLAKSGAENGGNREYVPISGIPKSVQDAVISAEDRNFYHHDGIDTKGIMRAAWNNLTGGETQGASTITQQYARAAANLTGITYARKLREAVLASKLNQEYTKPQILEFYLNTIYLGRGAYGIQAASRAYFDKTVDKLTAAEGAVLAAVIKQPDGGYDPATNLAAAKDRWTYVIDGMVKMGSVPAAEQATIQYPKVLSKAPTSNCVAVASCGANTPVGNVINYVKSELADMGITDMKVGGYRITTTINPTMQKAAQAAAQRVKGSPMNGQPKNLMAAMVSVDPKTGRVLAYYGGETGTGYDYAGLNTDSNGNIVGGHSPGSTFKVYTMAAALKDGISTESRWDALKLNDPDRGSPLTNAGRDDDSKVSCGHRCTMEESAIQSYNVPFYWITKEISPGKVVDAAKAAGIQDMWTTGNKTQMVDLTKIKSGAQVAPSKFDTVVGFGQYPITVLDHANGMATFADGGVYHKAHFVLKVEKKGEDGKYKVVAGAKEKGERRFDQDQMDDLNAVLQKIPEHNNDDLDDNRPAIGKTGTWELGDNSKNNGDAWMIGATPQLATAVWVGTQGTRKAIKDKNGKAIGGSGLPADIWRQFMDDALKDAQIEDFPPAQHTGDASRGNGTQQQDNNNQDNQTCFLPAAFCSDNNDDNDQNNNQNNNNDNGNNNGRGGFNNTDAVTTPTATPRN